MIAGIVVMLAVMGIRIFIKEPIEKGQRITPSERHGEGTQFPWN